MKKINIILFLLLFAGTSLVAQNNGLKFSSEGKFKIIQFTDLHYKVDVKESEVVIQLIEEVLDQEKPDLVVFTGDIVYSKPVKRAMDEIFAPVIKRKILWAYTFGNHDDEWGTPNEELMDYAMQKPYCMSIHGDKSLKGVGNYVLEIKGQHTSKTQAILYMMDSGNYTPIKGIGTYDWFSFDQVDWYRKESRAYTQENEGQPLPALAFFHIPLAEYPLMKANPSSVIIGNKDEKECNGYLNTGMFAAMRQSGDVMGTFVGHDHNNDYIGCYYDIALAYGRCSAGKTTYTDLGLNGCRVIELTEGERSFHTYIKLRGGEKLFDVTYPTSFQILP